MTLSTFAAAWYKAMISSLECICIFAVTLRYRPLDDARTVTGWRPNIFLSAGKPSAGTMNLNRYSSGKSICSSSNC